MINLVKAEILNKKRKFYSRFLWLMPLIAVITPMVLIAGMFVQKGAYNFWYGTFLPAILTIIVAGSTNSDYKNKWYGNLSVVKDKKQIWISKILSHTLYLANISFIFFILSIIVGKVTVEEIKILDGVIASIVLVITFAWQIPLWMFSSIKIGSFFTIVISLLSNIGFGTYFATGNLWMVPFSIPDRLMIPILGILPNGLPADLTNPLRDYSVVFLGIVINICLYVLLSFITSKLFEKEEV